MTNIAGIILEERERLEKLILIYEEKVNGSFTEDQRIIYMGKKIEAENALEDIQPYVELAMEEFR